MKAIKKLFSLMGRKWYLPFAAVIWDEMVYYGANLMAQNRFHHNWELSLDRLIPFLPWTVSIYFACFLFWGVSYVLCTIQEDRLAYRFFLADFLCKVVCLVFFLLLPTTNVRPEITGTGFWDQVMRFLYWVDAPANLFPSIHCMVSWLCYIGARNDPRLPVWYRRFSCLFALAVFASTLTTKQHVLVDVVAGMLLAELGYWVAGPLYERYERYAARKKAA